MLGTRLKKARLKAGFTQKELAQKSGISQEMICQIELGKKQPTVKLASKLTAALRISLDDLVH